MSGTRIRRSAGAPTRGEWGVLFLAGGALVWALVGWSTLPLHVETVLSKEYARAGDRWTAWVDAGVPPDSATAVVVAELRARLAGQTPATPRPPFIEEANTEWQWQARQLNPFSDPRTTLPRTPREVYALEAARTDIELTVRAGTPTLHRLHLIQARWRVVGAAVLLGTLLGLIAVRRQRRLTRAAQRVAVRVLPPEQSAYRVPVRASRSAGRGSVV